MDNTQEKTHTISGIVQKLMLQLTDKNKGKGEAVCVAIVFTEEESPNYKRHMMSLNEDDFSEWDSVKERLSLAYEELREVIAEYFDTKVAIFKFRDYRISDMFFLSDPIEEVKNSEKTPFEIMEKHYNKEVCNA